MKKCGACKTLKDSGDFTRNTRSKDGLWQYCKLCDRKRANGSRAKFRDKRNSDLKEYYQKNRPRFIWQRAKYRCTSQKHSHYKYYGGKGIGFHISLRDVEYLFLRDGGSSMARPSLDRIDSSGDYILANCRIIETTENIRRMAVLRLHAKLNWDTVEKIRRGYQAGKSRRSLSAEFQVSKAQISRIIRNVCWGSVRS